MYLTSLSGKRTISVALATCNRIIDCISTHHGLTIVEYRDLLLVPEPTINMVIERYLMALANDGKIAVSDRGRRPDWYYATTNPATVPVRKVVHKTARTALRGITIKELRQDYAGLVGLLDSISGRHLAPATLDRARREFVERVNHVGSNHQDVIDTTSAQIATMQSEMKGMKEALQVLASAVTSKTLKIAA